MKGRSRRGEVDQIAAVRDNRMEARTPHRGPEFVDFFTRQHPAAPLVRVLGEDLEGIASMEDRPRYGARHPAGDRHMGAEPRAGHGPSRSCTTAPAASSRTVAVKNARSLT